MRTSRRGFLKTLGGVALFSIVPRHVLGNGYIAPSDQLTKGIIGTGGMGRGHVNYAGTRLVAVCDVDKNHLELGKKLVKEKMTEDERRQAEEQERLQAQAKRDLDLTIKGLKLDVVDAVQEMGLDAGFRNLIAVEDLATIVDEDERKAKLTERVKGMKKLFDAEVAKEVAKAKAEFLKGSTPATGSSSNKKDETKYDEYKKAGNVKGMISEKLNAYRNRDEE